jgi:hypothetical protein
MSDRYAVRAGGIARAPGHTPASARTHRRPRLGHGSPYRWLIALVLAANCGALAWRTAAGGPDPGDARALPALASLTLVNLAAAVLVRQSRLLTLLFALAGRAPRTWRPGLRRSVANVHHVGGLHVGAALAGTAWLAAFAAVAVTARLRDPASVSPVTAAAACALAVLTLVIVFCALPVVRRRAHDVFEMSHRFGGWGAVALFWVLTVDTALGRRGGGSAPEALAGSWQVWLLAVLTASIALPWLGLRRVPVTIERPSSHAVVVRLDYGVTPAIASAVAISRSPLGQWHSFASVSTPGRSGFRLLVSRAGDWTGAFVDDPPSHVWVRGLPTRAPLACVEVLFERVVYVVTGSGIGPCLGQVLAARVPARLVWSARSPQATFGPLAGEVLAAQPDAVIWDTAVSGKPDLVRLALDAVSEFDAGAVFVVSNQAATRRLVRTLQERGVPAFGPIWDS